MATFPKTEEEIIALANDVAGGLQTHSDIFPAPPVDALTLENSITAYASARDAAVSALAASKQATDNKKAALKQMKGELKRILRYAETTTSFDDTKLQGLGWGGRRPRQPLAALGQVLDVVSVEQGDDWIKLSWEKPVDGGKVAAYDVMSRERLSEGSWNTVGMTTDREITLTSQETGKKMEYTVVATNKSGKGPVGNVVMAVL
ncbi:MAG: hypothetical protein BECKG1743D_GA0114223_107763 [Candidatus Kentron sp. G]|nr:MAG: hypothetical protein BECKG1743F_GA0114225_107631 [Candidatus Kentron sp. G]VFN04649.1 MAG: hypothetical protein BECKG1743E_GA0114224_107571 [Candidatus Kentron sp. G]VFN05844.1 MAG: hypothetical protein BECKG1743D_GA0114223_107763 [Candidatus Kentron sp. G]